MKSMDVKLAATDGVEIAGTYIPGSLPLGIIFLHMMPATRQSFGQFAERLAAAGLHTLAIDLRGHGDSGGGDYQAFSDDQHQKSILDVLAAADYLRKHFPDMKIGLVGASIGANLALQYAAANAAEFAVLLSPGLNYRGIEAGRLAASLPEDLPLYFASALDDGRVPGNAAETETLYNSCSSQRKNIQIFREGGHGTDLLKNQQFTDALVEWIKEVIK